MQTLYWLAHARRQFASKSTPSALLAPAIAAIASARVAAAGKPIMAFLHDWIQTPPRPFCFRAAGPFCLLAGDLYHLAIYTAAALELSSQPRNWCWSRKQRRNVFVAQNPKAPTLGRGPLHDPPEPPANDPPINPLRDPPGDPTYEPPQPSTDPTPNPASDPPRELPHGIAWYRSPGHARQWEGQPRRRPF
jgi:hypothetical protein